MGHHGLRNCIALPYRCKRRKAFSLDVGVNHGKGMVDGVTSMGSKLGHVFVVYHPLKVGNVTVNLGVIGADQMLDDAANIHDGTSVEHFGNGVTFKRKWWVTFWRNFFLKRWGVIPLNTYQK